MSGVVGTMEVTGFMQLKMGWLCVLHICEQRQGGATN